MNTSQGNIQIRRAGERGHFDHGWLKTNHTFSFGGYQDPAHMGFRSLRVMNEDWVSAGQGFGMHGHENMEIVTVVLEGELEHKDSMGNGEVLRPGELQRMSAGTGIRHSEFNPSADNPTHLYQIWLTPEAQGLTPSYEQKAFDMVDQANRLKLVASREARDGSLAIHQDSDLYLSALSASQQITHHLAPDRHAWLQTLNGSVAVNGQLLATGDGIAISGVAGVEISAETDAQILLFDLS